MGGSDLGWDQESVFESSTRGDSDSGSTELCGEALAQRRKGMAPWKAHRPHQDLALPSYRPLLPIPHISIQPGYDTFHSKVAKQCTLSVPTTKNEVNTLPLGTIVQWITTEVVRALFEKF